MPVSRRNESPRARRSLRSIVTRPPAQMSAFPRDPDHFVRWLRDHHDPRFQPHDFAPRAVFGRYVESLLTTATEFPGNARLVRRHAKVVDVTRSGRGFVVGLSDGVIFRPETDGLSPEAEDK